MNPELHSQIADLKRRHETLFKPGLGCCRVVKAELKLQAVARLVFRSRRPVPYTTHSLVEAELNRLQSEVITEPVHYTEWVTPIVVGKKANVLDSALETHQYPLLGLEDLFSELIGANAAKNLA
ncbi:unnamed protein product [Dicrocoelium dendriticum]|nr:unnamed protein product [Dicrocoelium dendriticum]